MGTREDPDRPVGSEGAPAPPGQWLCLARGFSFLFWGLGAMLALLLGQAALDLGHGIRVPAYVLGVALAAWGAARLREAGPVTPRWQRRARRLQGLAWLALYFAPFAAWWTVMPQVTLYLVNVLALAFTVMALFLAANLMAADVFRRCGLAGARLETLAYAAGVAVLMMAPYGVGLLFAFVGAVRYNVPFVDEVMRIGRRVPPWCVAAATLPCSLSLVGVWKARTLCYQRLWHERGGAPPDASARESPTCTSG